MNEILILTRKWVEHRCLFTNIHVESIKINWRNFTIRKTVFSFIQVEKHNRPITFTLLKLIKKYTINPCVCLYEFYISWINLNENFFQFILSQKEKFSKLYNFFVYSFNLNFCYIILSCCNNSIVEITYWKYQAFVKDIETGKRLIYLDL